ncbi:2-oxoacid:acceptor oxidoreductase family protein [Desulfurococcus mucosus]|uniref:pyruvate synthase n=1 Tax=Desulfurococcus mucosus (strain ATCC 35584 / DSM 2162 / JCM 9187 / O7/1) TaxID=765177 RepID=E8RAQ0_DESM0|nr:pyruvate/ketoisovalerate oxidoreductase, gamma subunit [Desulfurococcus mucosus DSM 2162]
MLYEILFFGRGGQGAVTAANILVEAAMMEGKHGQGFPFFGAERRGAPVTAFARISDKPILRHGMFSEADIIVVLDPGLLDLGVVKRGVLRENGVVVVNTEKDHIPPGSLNHRGRARIYRVDATRIARELGLVIAGWPVVNTSMLGALAKATGLIGVESVEKAIGDYFGGKAGELNKLAAERAYGETKLVLEV